MREVIGLLLIGGGTANLLIAGWTLVRPLDAAWKAVRACEALRYGLGSVLVGTALMVGGSTVWLAAVVAVALQYAAASIVGKDLGRRMEGRGFDAAENG